MSKISPCLWFNGEAEEAANLYVSLVPDSRITKIQRNPIDGPAGKAGTVLVVEFTLAGQSFMALNGGRRFEYTHAISFKIDCADQDEVDYYWERLTEGGEEGPDELGPQPQVEREPAVEALVEAQLPQAAVAPPSARKAFDALFK